MGATEVGRSDGHGRRTSGHGRGLVVKVMLIGLVPLLLAAAIMYMQARSNAAGADRRNAQAKAAAAAAAIGDIFQGWRNELLIAANNDILRRWYADPADRDELRPAVEGMLVQLHSLYPDLVDEACLIDVGGIEAARQVRGEPAPLQDLSPDESEASFFAPTFALDAGGVYQNSPYVSADSGRWVISNTTPLVVGGAKVGLLHFEGSLQGMRVRLQKMLGPGGEARVVDRATGKVVIDTSARGPIGSRAFRSAGDSAAPGGTVSATAPVAVGRGNRNRWAVEVFLPRSSPLSGGDAIRFAVFVVLTLVGLVFAARSFIRSLVDPIDEMTEVATRLADGDLTARIEVKRDDEVGSLGNAVNAAVDNLHTALRDIVSETGTLSGQSTDMAALSAKLADGARETSAEAEVLASAAEQVASTSSASAAGVEAITASIDGIAAQAVEAGKVASAAVALAETARGAVGGLRQSSAEISEVVNTITAVAAQTNLLALNATIEAARSGEAGRGFAVVAGEVKDLARQTSEATAGISARADAILADTAAVASAMDDITEVIGRIDSVQSSISAVVEEQSATTLAITGNVEDSLKAANGISSSTATVAEAVQTTATGAMDTRDTASRMAHMATVLTELVGRFRV